MQEYRPQDRPFEPAIGNADTLDAIGAYADRFLGSPRVVLHELSSHLIHLDVHICPPSTQFDCYTLITSGMSDRPMPKAAEWGVPPFAELMIRLPKNWPVPTDSEVVSDFNTEKTWPIGALKQAARMPHDCGSALGWGHTIAFTNPPSPLHSSVRFISLLLLPTVHHSTAAGTVETRDGRTIHIYVLHPLLPDEFAFKRSTGDASSLFPFMDAHQLSEVIDIDRESILRPAPASGGSTTEPQPPLTPQTGLPTVPKKWWRLGF